MSASLSLELLDLAAGGVLVSALAALWRRDLRAAVVAVSAQGVALGAAVVVLSAREHDPGLGAIAGLVLLVKGLVVPLLLGQVLRREPGSRESSPLVNVPASLVAASVLIVVAYLASGRLTELVPSATSRLAPLGTATVLLGLFLLVTRQKALSQIVGLLVVDNGIALLAFLLTSGVPLVVELGASLDVLLVVVVLRVLATRMRRALGSFDLDDLRELRD